MGAFLELLRLPHWIKNIAVMAALPFGWLKYGFACTPYMLVAVLAFCFASSAIYALNDVVDRREDLLHPKKKDRPVARGAVSPAGALGLGAGLALAALIIGWFIPQRFFLLCLAGYLIMMVAYSLSLKHQPILDVIIIASGFVLRAVAGAAAIDVYISPWLVVCTFTLCLFLGFGKRRSEVFAISHMPDARKHRRTLTHYSADLLNQLLSTSAGIALVTFMLYIMDWEKLDPEQPAFNKRPLLYTFPLVAYGIFRYAMLIETGRVSGPTDIILKDRVLLSVILIWTLTSAIIILFEPLSALLGQG